MIGTLLIANRGEVAVRVIHACRELGIRAVAVHSEADAGAYWTRLADETLAIGPAPARQSYLDIDAIVTAAKSSGADAVHPGYGLLSESAEFAEAVRAAGMIFIGPRAETIALMGDKVAARGAAAAAGVPVLPGSDGPVADVDAALAQADAIGWPLAVKASFGGGGRGLRVATERTALADALAQASREAAAAFGRAEVFLERFLPRPRHVEVQVMADAHGNVVHMGTRDCSVQRRHQKLLEEAPAPGLAPYLRDRIEAAAITLCRSVSYEGAGTVEFLVDCDTRSFFFLEMNTRLQVEHGVTELVTGIDIVREQITVAQGARLSFAQDDMAIHGHAIQARLTAEDPWDGFRAAPGRIDALALPAGPWLRADLGVEAGDIVPVHYDSLVGKLHAWGRTRDEARRRLAVALKQVRIDGVPDSAPYLRGILDEPDFVAVRHDTGSLERDWAPDPAFRPDRTSPAPLTRRSRREVRVPWGGRTIAVTVHGGDTGCASALPLRTASRPASVRAGGEEAGDAAITAPMDAVVVAVSCTPGQDVTKGEQLLLLEAMKMEVVIAAPHDGRVESVPVKPGDAVKSGTTLAVLPS